MTRRPAWGRRHMARTAVRHMDVIDSLKALVHAGFMAWKP